MSTKNNNAMFRTDEEISETLKNKRKETGLSQDEAAKKLGRSASTIKKIENPEISCPIENYFLYAEVLDLKPLDVVWNPSDYAIYQSNRQKFIQAQKGVDQQLTSLVLSFPKEKKWSLVNLLQSLAKISSETTDEE